MRKKLGRWVVVSSVVIALISAPASWASLITGCDDEGRFHIFIVDDETGIVTGHINTTGPDPRCG